MCNAKKNFYDCPCIMCLACIPQPPRQPPHMSADNTARLNATGDGQTPECFFRRAVRLLNSIWLAYREEIYADDTDQIVWKSPRRLILRSGCLEKVIRKRPGIQSPLHAFPDHICKTPKDKVILLNFLQCHVAVTHMQCVADWLLRGKVTVWRRLRYRYHRGPDEFLRHIQRYLHSSFSA